MISIADGIGLLIAVVVVATIADRLRIAYPILLVVVGVVIALVPLHHDVELPPELILLVFLPPLIYEATLDTSIAEIRAHLRPILALAVGLVLATMAAVAVAIHTLVHGMSWPVALTLGAIVSPPDSIAATQVAGKLGLPRRLITILGGEGMMNDATALTAYQVSVAAVGTSVTVVAALGRFGFAIVGGVGIGLAVGWLTRAMLRFIETPAIESTLLLALPFGAYLPADKVGASGVLAVVVAGLFFGRYGSGSLTAAARLQQREIWDLFAFLLTGLSFLLVGLELRPVLDSLTDRESGSLTREALAVVGIVLVIRFVWMFAAAALPIGYGPLGRGTGHHGSGHRGSFREATVMSWSGMRGAVSMAAALALPRGFPERDLIVFVTFAVIVATLVGQGLTLPPLIRRLGLVTRDEQDTVTLLRTRRRLTQVALKRIEDLGEMGRFPPEVVERLYVGYELQLTRIDRGLASLEGSNDGAAAGEGSTTADGEGPTGGSAAGVTAVGADGTIPDGEVGEPVYEAQVDPAVQLRAERDLRRIVIDAERVELDQLLGRRKISQRVAANVRSLLDVDEISMRPGTA